MDAWMSSSYKMVSFRLGMVEKNPIFASYPELKMSPALPLKNSVNSVSVLSIKGLFPEINLEPVLPFEKLISSKI